MRPTRTGRRRRNWSSAAAGILCLLHPAPSAAAGPPGACGRGELDPVPLAEVTELGDPDRPTAPAEPIDLPSALRLAGVDNPDLLAARERVVEAIAVRQLAAAQLLPTLNLGANYDSHTGPLQQGSGNIVKINRSSLYVGAGANAVGAGTVNIPGLVYNLNVSDAIFTGLITRQGVDRASAAAAGVQHDVLRRVAVAYAELLRAVGRRAVAEQTRAEAAEVARLTAAYAKSGQGSDADADRAAAELEYRREVIARDDAEILIASARLAELLSLGGAGLVLRPVDERLVPCPAVPDVIPFAELLAIATVRRPELAEWQAGIRQALFALRAAQLLPFSPDLIIGLSGGTFGGGSGLVASARTPRFGAPLNQPRFGEFGPRNDFDAVAYWTLRNLGAGNKALVDVAAARLSVAEVEKLRVLNRVRREVAEAYVRAQTRLAQIGLTEQALRSGLAAFREDVRRIEGGVGLPIALLASLRELAEARANYLTAIVDYNEAQIDLYVAIGNPPADVLARPVPTDFTAPVPAAPGRKPEDRR